MACALFDAKLKTTAVSIAIVFRFALVLRAFSKWGVPQTTESNTKVLLNERGQQKRAILHNTHALWEASHNSSFAPQTPYLMGCTFIYEEKPMAKFNGLVLNNVVKF